MASVDALPRVSGGNVANEGSPSSMSTKAETKQRPPPIKIKESNTLFGPLQRLVQGGSSAHSNNEDIKRKSRSSPSKATTSPRVAESVTFGELHRNHMPYLDEPFGVISPSDRRGPSPRSSSPAMRVSRVPVPPLSPPQSAPAAWSPVAGPSEPPRRSSKPSSTLPPIHRRANSVDYVTTPSTCSFDDPLSQRSSSMSAASPEVKRRPSTATEGALPALVVDPAPVAKPVQRAIVSMEVTNGDKTRILSTPMLDAGVSIRLATDLRPQDVDVNFSCETRFDSNGVASSQWVVRVVPKAVLPHSAPATVSGAGTAMQRQQQQHSTDLFSYSLASPTTAKRQPRTPRGSSSSPSPSSVTKRGPSFDPAAGADSPHGSPSPQRPLYRPRRFSSNESSKSVPGRSTSTSSSFSSDSSIETPLTPRRSRLPSSIDPLARVGAAGQQQQQPDRRPSHIVIASPEKKHANRTMSIVDMTGDDDDDDDGDVEQDYFAIPTSPKSPKRAGRFFTVHSANGPVDLASPDERDFQSLLSLAASDSAVLPPQLQTRKGSSLHKPTKSDSTILPPPHTRANVERRMISRWSDTETDIDDLDRPKTSWSDLADELADEVES